MSTGEAGFKMSYAESREERNVSAAAGGQSVYSMTPAGISHQALYARDDPLDTGEMNTSGKNNKLLLYMACDDDSLSAYQCLVRKQIELFEAKEEDVESNAQGRNKPIVSGQVGIRCRHCSNIPPRHRTRGATYYPAKLHGLYQAAQNMASAHLCNHCQLIPDSLRKDLIILRDRKSSAGGGKQYWADGVRVLGVVETDNILCLIREETAAESEKEEEQQEGQEDVSSQQRHGATSEGIQDDIEPVRDNNRRDGSGGEEHDRSFRVDSATDSRNHSNSMARTDDPDVENAATT